MQVRGVLEGKPTQYFCLAGCINGRGKNRGTNTFQISAGQGWQSVFEHCCSEGHFMSICTNNSNPAADKNKQDIAGVKDRYRDEVEPFAKRCAKQRKQARVQQGSSAPIKKRRARAQPTCPAPAPQQNVDQQQLNRIQAKFASFAAKRGVSPETVDAMVNQGVKLQQGARQVSMTSCRVCRSDVCCGGRVVGQAFGPCSCSTLLGEVGEHARRIAKYLYSK